MSAQKIDVLAELRTMRKRFVNCAMAHGSGQEFAEGACESFDTSVAVVAELIEALQEATAAMDYINTAHPESSGAWQRCDAFGKASAVLARIGGAA